MATRKFTSIGPEGMLILEKTVTPKKNWSEIVKTNVSISGVPKTLDNNKKTKPVEVDIKLKIPLNSLDKIYPDVLITLMQFMDEKSYLSFTASSDSLEDMSLTNIPFLNYIKRYKSKKEFQNIINQKKTYLKKLKGLEQNYLYYTIHKELYPYYYYTKEEEEEFEEEEKYTKEEYVKEYADYLDEDDYEDVDDYE